MCSENKTFLKNIELYEKNVLDVFYISKNRKEIYEKTGLVKRNNKIEILNFIIEKNKLDSKHLEKKSKYVIIEKKCPICNTVFTSYNDGKNSKIFCSKSCGNKNRKLSDETKTKISNSLINSEKHKISCLINKEIRKNNKDKWDLIYQKRKELTKQNILIAEYSSLSYEKLKLRILYEQDEKCNKCGLNEWLGEPLTLELEHKDGNNKNNNRNNLECLCPNCHSLTLTWRGRNKRCNINRVSDETLLISLINNNFNMRKALLEVGLSAKGGNYNRCHKLKKEFSELK